jgi:NADH-quinone oxidoreductase subunit I
MTTPRGVISLKPADCTSCMLCVRECPTWCISLDSHQAPDPETPAGARVRLINVLDDFRIDFSRCMSCGICVEVCPFDALAWEAETDYDEPTRDALTHHTDRMSAHRGTSPDH